MAYLRGLRAWWPRGYWGWLCRELSGDTATLFALAEAQKRLPGLELLDSTFLTGVDVRGAGKLALTLREHFEDALLFRRIATVDLDAPVSESVDDMIWKGPSAGFDERCAELGAERVATRAHELFWKYEG